MESFLCTFVCTMRMVFQNSLVFVQVIFIRYNFDKHFLSCKSILRWHFIIITLFCIAMLFSLFVSLFYYSFLYLSIGYNVFKSFSISGKTVVQHEYLSYRRWGSSYNNNYYYVLFQTNLRFEIRSHTIYLIYFSYLFLPMVFLRLRVPIIIFFVLDWCHIRNNSFRYNNESIFNPCLHNPHMW